MADSIGHRSINERIGKVEINPLPVRNALVLNRISAFLRHFDGMSRILAHLD